MPRQRRGATPARNAPARPTAPQSRPKVMPQPQHRSTSTTSHPPQTAQQAGAPTQAGKGSGLFGQMASTAAYVWSR